MEKFPQRKTESPKIERKSAWIRIVGVKEAIEQEALEDTGEIFKMKQEKEDDELEKTPEQKAVIRFINQKLPDFLKLYGAAPLRISEDKVHLMPKSFFKRGKASIGAFYYPNGQSVYVKDRPDLPLAAFAQRLVHEFVHFNAFQSVEVYSKHGHKNLRQRRSGFKTAEKGREGQSYFHFLDEAITEELTRRFNQEFLAKLAALKKDFEAVEFLKENNVPMEIPYSDLAYVVRDKKNENLKAGDEAEVEVFTFSYADARKKLNDLTLELYEKNKDQFKSPEEIFVLFAQAAMTGRLLPVARLIEKTFGKGAFRKLGEETEGKLEKI